MIRLFECFSSKNVCLEPNKETEVSVYTKNIQIRDNDNISFFENFKLDDAGVHGAGTKYDGKKLYIFLLNTGESDVNVKRGEYLGNILLEEIISRE